ncbi:MAG: TRAP transporter large permease subunit, partial [Oscillospiraceae bacterium]|nr:TRAP transporter large permease subunit [Oscillospiraceae bacterium]
MAIFRKKSVEDRNKNVNIPDTELDVEAVMRKYDRESNTRIWTGKAAIAIRIFMALFSAFCIYVTLGPAMLEQARLTSFVGLIIVIGYLNYPASKKHVRANHIPWYDIVIMVLGAGAFFYYTFNAMDIVKLSYGGVAKNPALLVIGIIGILAIVELCRRSVGLPILFVAGFFVLYAFIGKNLSIRRVVYELFYGENGVLTTPVNVCSKYIVIFIIFGAFLEKTGIAEYFISLANKLFGAAAG